MFILGYGIKLKRLTIDDIELVRHHRNSEKIKQYMEYREYISEQQQLGWFNSINNIHNNYFIIIADNKKVGLIYGADINWQTKTTGNGGIFIWDTNYWNSGTPGAASFLLTDTSILLGLKKTYVKVLNTNHRAIAFNKKLGYELMPDQEDCFNQLYMLDIEKYKENRETALNKLFPHISNTEIEIIFKTNNEVNQFYLDLISKSPNGNNKDFKMTNLIK